MTDNSLQNDIQPEQEFLLRCAVARTSAPDAKLAFEEFAMRNSRDAKPDRKTKSISMYAWLAAAACVAVCFVLHSLLVETAGTGTVTQVYDAIAYDDTDISVSIGGKTVTLDNLRQQHLGINVSAGNEITLSPELVTEEEEVLFTEVNVPIGKTATLTLSDGTKVWLGANSRLTFPSRFEAGKERNVKLAGQAYFNVHHDESSPFIVEGNGLTTKVLGTEFDVRNIEGEHPRVTLIHGSVAVSHDNYEVVLKPEQMACVSEAGGLSVGHADVDVVTSWKNGSFYFDGQTMRDILVEVGRWYNIDVLFLSKDHIDDKIHFSAERNWSVQETIGCLNQISSAEIRIDKGRIVVN